ncbi:hypothetical protein ACLOJK_019064 [Asimina triloba]
MGARARPPCTHEHEHGAPKVLYHLHELGLPPLSPTSMPPLPSTPPVAASKRRPSPPANAARRRQHTPPVAAMHLLTVDGDEEDDEPTPTAVGPTIAGPSLPPSEPFITTTTMSSFKIRRGRKPTLITEATRGETSSPVINKFNSIQLRSEAWIDRSRPFIMIATGPINVCHRSSSARGTHHGRITPCSPVVRPSQPRRRTPSRTLPVPLAFAEAAHMNAPCSSRLQHVVNVGSAVDDRRFALKAAAKATVPAAIVTRKIFYK